MARNRQAQAGCANVVLLAQDEAGYGNLMRLASRAYFDVALGDAAPGRAPRSGEHAPTASSP